MKTATSSRIILNVVTVLAMIVTFGPVACASWWANTPSHITDVAAILKCVGEKADEGKTPKDIAIECGLENADKVLDLLKQQRALEARHSKAGTATSASASASSQPCK